jgi:uncharacterized protein
MAVTMYSQSIPVLVKSLKALSAILDKAAAHCTEKKIEESVMTTHVRLAADMFPLNRQIFIAADMAKGAAARLAGVEIPKYEDTEVSFEELKARIAKTIAFLESTSKADIDGSTEKPIEIKLGNGQVYNFTGHTYLNGWVLPNFYFHCTTAYNILRHNGVAIGKADFLA